MYLGGPGRPTESWASIQPSNQSNGPGQKLLSQRSLRQGTSRPSVRPEPRGNELCFSSETLLHVILSDRNTDYGHTPMEAIRALAHTQDNLCLVCEACN